jgi:hypothetical protein
LSSTSAWDVAPVPVAESARIAICWNSVGWSHPLSVLPSGATKMVGLEPRARVQVDALYPPAMLTDWAKFTLDDRKS